MDLSKLFQVSNYEWHIPKTGSMHVPGILFGDETLIMEMDDKVYEQVVHVASLPGIVTASFAMPDAHWGYGFPIGGVAAFDPQRGVVSAGGVGFDISCGVRTLLTGLKLADIHFVKEQLADLLFHTIPAGVGSRGFLRLSSHEMDAMLRHGAVWAVGQGFGRKEDLERIEHGGQAHGADPDYVSDHAKKRQAEELGTLGSGNHYVEIQEVRELYDEKTAAAFGLSLGDIVVSIHCGSRGLGHQVATDYAKKMLSSHNIKLPDRDLACAPLVSPVAHEYLFAMRSAMNCALANRQILTHHIRDAFSQFFPKTSLPLLYDVSHNTCLEETHLVDGAYRTLFIHRKGATRALGPGHPHLPASLQQVGQPVLIGGTMGTASYILVGTEESKTHAFSSACHGAGRQMSRTQATKRWQGRDVVSDLERRGMLVRCSSFRGIAEEAPGAYKNVDAVVEATDAAGLARKVAKLIPVACVKG